MEQRNTAANDPFRNRITPLAAILAAMLAAGAHEALAAPRADLTVLPTLGGVYGGAQGINDTGQVVGYSSASDGMFHAFIWYDTGSMRDLGTLGGDGSYAWDLNEAGQVVGYSDTGTSGSGYHAFVWDNVTGMRDLGTLGGDRSMAYSINDVGQVVGWSQDASGVHRAFLWDATGGMRDMGTLGGFVSDAHDINNAGQVVGYSETSDLGIHAFLWDATGGMRDLGTLGGDRSYARSINNAGQVVGRSDVASGDYHAFLWQGGVMRDLGTLGGADSSAVDINDAGQVVGAGRDASGALRAFLWTDGGGMTDLNGLTAGTTMESARGINEYAQVVGTTTDDKAFLLTLHPDWQGGDGYWDDTANPHWNWAGTGVAPAKVGFMHDVVIDPGNDAIVYGSLNGQARSITIGGSGFGNGLDLNGGLTSVAGDVRLRDGGGLMGAGGIEATTIQFEANSWLVVGGIASGDDMELIAEVVFDDTTEIFMNLNSAADHDTLYTGDIVNFNPMQLNGADLWVTASSSLFSPGAGDEFKLFDWATGVMGTFDIMGLPNLDPGLRWDLSDLYTTGVLRVAAVPVPAAVWLFGSGLIGLIATARRRPAVSNGPLV